MTLTLLLIYALAARRAVDTWTSSSLFARARAALEARGEAAALAGKRSLLAELAGCPFCLAHWPPVLLLLLGLPLWWIARWVAPGDTVAATFAAHSPAFCLAATQVAIFLSARREA